VPGVFISYRREDSAAYAGRLFDVLSTEFGQENTFMDVDDIKGGDNFVTVIDRNLDVSDALLAVIGSNWLPPTWLSDWLYAPRAGWVEPVQRK
jgi:hypothetical protein